MNIPETIEEFRLAIEAEQELRVEMLEERAYWSNQYHQTKSRHASEEYELRKHKAKLCGMRIDAMQRGLDALQGKYSGKRDGRWCFSDQMLAELTRLCELHGHHALISEARETVRQRQLSETSKP